MKRLTVSLSAVPFKVAFVVGLFAYKESSVIEKLKLDSLPIIVKFISGVVSLVFVPSVNGWRPVVMLVIVPNATPTAITKTAATIRNISGFLP